MNAIIQWSIIDMAGRNILPGSYDDVYLFRDGQFTVKKGEKKLTVNEKTAGN